MPDFPPDFYEDVDELERYLNLPKGSLRQIPFYALRPAIDAILKVREMESKSIFRPGLYYIVLADLCENTSFNAKYGDAEGDLRTQWFHTAAIEALGDIKLENYVAFSKTIGDASLFVFSSFRDVFNWSNCFTTILGALSKEYEYDPELTGRFTNESRAQIQRRVREFKLRARRLVHLGEVSYKENVDPLSLAVSQTFKIEKTFSETHLGCTEVVADAIRPKLNELGVRLQENRKIAIPGTQGKTMTYYIRPKRKAVT
jgi:hypothetical protein